MNIFIIVVVVISLLVVIKLSKKSGSSSNNSRVDAGVIDYISSGKTKVGVSRNLGGSICSILYNGNEIIDREDYGRELQSAFTCGNQGERFNPTEAGGSLATNPVSSKVMGYSIINNIIRTTVNMAFWNKVNGKSLSDSTHSKSVEFITDNIIMVNVSIKPNGTCKQMITEMLTAYAVKSLNVFYTYDGRLIPFLVNPNTAEQTKIPVMSNPDGSLAIALYSPVLPQGDLGYGFFLIDDHPKINAVFRHGSVSDKVSYKVYVVIGTLSEVEASLASFK